jgi:hypothetical protein
MDEKMKRRTAKGRKCPKPADCLYEVHIAFLSYGQGSLEGGWSNLGSYILSGTGRLLVVETTIKLTFLVTVGSMLLLVVQELMVKS